MEEPREESVEEPTQSEQDAQEAATFMAKELLSIALVSIAALLLLVLGLMQATGVIDILGAGIGSESIHWLGFVGLVLLVIAAFAWSRRGI